MAHIEIDSFVQKFKNLWHAGLKASLNVDAENGEASVTLKADLGYIPPPFHVLRPHGQPPRPQRGPAYQRRQERRQAARAAAGNAASHAEEVIDIVVSDDASHAEEVSDALVGDNVNEELRESIPKAEEVREPSSQSKKNEAEKAQENFPCLLCDFKSNWENGLNIHMARKHTRIEQIDGNIEDSFQDEEYEATKHYWETGRLGSVYQVFLDANEVIEKCELSEDEKEKEKAKVSEARKNAFGSQYIHFPPWNLRS